MKRLLVIILNILLISQSCFSSVINAKTIEANSSLKNPVTSGEPSVPAVLLNGEVSLYSNPVTVQYGQPITLAVDNADATELEFYYQTSNIEDMWWTLEDGLALMAPNHYYIGYNCWVGDDMIDNTLGSVYGFTVTKGQLKAPANLNISTFPTISWNATTQTIYNYSLAADTITNYSVELYCDGQLVNTLTSTTTSLDVTSAISGLYGVFTFKVKANVSSSNANYISSNYSALSSSFNNDAVIPEISSISSNATHTKLTINAIDGETGIVAYAFSNSDSTTGLSWIDCTKTPNVTQSFEKTLTQSETLYFFCKDTNNNIKVSDAIIVSKVTLHYNSPKANESFYLVGNTDSLPLDGSIVRSGFTFKGWYPDAELSGNAITEVDGDGLANDKHAYASWQTNETTIDVTSYNNKTYDGTSHNITATFNGVYDTDTLQWQWYRHDTNETSKLVGETSASLCVKNVSDSDNYYAIATYQLEGVTYTTISDASIVLINKAQLTVTADDKNYDYGETVDEYTYQITGFAGSDTNSVVTIGEDEIACEYERWDDIGDYEITIDLTKFTADNYTFIKDEGTLHISSMDVTAAKSKVTVSLDADSFVYDTNAKTPILTIMDDDVVVPSSNYTITYADNTNAGVASVTVSFKANYQNDIVKYYVIEKAEPVITLVISDYKYDGIAHSPKINYSTTYKSEGTITYYYNGVASSHPINAGEYSVYAVIAETDNFKELTSNTVDYEIKKREIVLTANDASKVYDATPLTEDGYVETGDGFVGTDAFLSVTVTGSQTVVGSSDNVVSYVLTNATNSANYDISTVSGTLSVSEAKLKKPTNVHFNTNDTASARWLPVTCVEGNVSYTVELSDGTNTIATETTTNTAYDFSEVIHDYCETNETAASFCFRVKATCDNENIADSDFSGYSDDVYTIRVVLDKAEEISVTVDGTEVDEVFYMLPNETVSIVATASSGVLLSSTVYTCNESFISIADVNNTSTTFSTTALSSVNNNVTLKVNYYYDTPHITSFKAENFTETEGYLQKVVLKVKVTSNVKLVGWAISTNRSYSSITSWNDPTSDYSINETADVTAAGTYYLYVKDVHNKVVSSIGVNIYSVSFVASGATGTMPTILKVQGTNLNLPINKFEKDGYGFQNWLNSDGTLSYTDGSEYPIDANETLTAVWSHTQYNYTVNHFYEKTDGTYGDTPDTSMHYLGFYNNVISNSTDKVIIDKTGFEIVTHGDEPTSITITEQNQVLNIYYQRITYNFSYSYTDPFTNSTVTYASTDYKYGVSITDQDTPSTAVGSDFEGYHFVGWTYPGSGEKPSTMPAKDVTATGYFTATDVPYSVNFYVQKTDGTFRLTETMVKYGLADSELDDSSSYVTFAYEGHSYAGASITYGEAGSIAADAEYSDDPTGTIKGKSAEATNVNLYFTSNYYSITLKVFTTDTNLNVYEKTFGNILYGTTIDHEYYETDNGLISDEWCDTYHDLYRVSALKNWNCGSVPSTMRGMNITITRYIYPKKTTPRTFTANIYLETIDEGVYGDPISLPYLAQDGDGMALSYVTIGPDSTHNINYYSDFYKKYYFTQYYELDTDNPDNVLDITAGADLEFTDELTVYLKRKVVTQTIDYYFDDNETATKFATITRSDRWGVSKPMDILAFFEGGSYSGDGTLTFFDSAYSGVDFKNYEVDDVLRGCLVEYAASAGIGNGSYGTGRTRITKAEDLTKSYNIVMGQNGTSVVVYYHYIPDEKIFHCVDIKFRSGLLKATEADKISTQLTYEHDGTEYKIRACDKTYIYNWSFVPVGNEDYPAAGWFVGEYVYTTIKDGFTPITINSKTYYVDSENYLYNIITDPANPVLYEKNLGSASYPGNGLGTEGLSAYISNYMAAHEDDDPQNELVVMSGCSMGGSSVAAEFVATYGSYRTIYHTINGESCSGERVRAGSTPTAKRLATCKHSFTIPEGYTITWYMDSDCTVLPADNTTTMNLDIVLYGAYTYDMVYGTDAAYYSVPGAGYVQDLDSMSSSEVETQDITILDGAGVEVTYTVKTTTYYYEVDGVSFLAAVVRDHPSLCYTDVTYEWESADSTPVAFSQDDFDRTGYTFSSTNTNNVTSKAGSTVHADLKVFYSRNSYSLKSDYNNINGGISQKTQYRTYLNKVTLDSPTMENYNFTGWTWKKTNGDDWTDGPSGAGEDSVSFLMPHFGVVAKANFEPVEAEQVINYHYQNKNLAYDDSAELNTSDTITYKPEDVITLADYLSQKTHFELSSIVIIDNTTDNVYELGEDDTFTATGSMSIDYYYYRVTDDIEITSEIVTSDSGDHSATLTGDGKFYYEESATLKISYVDTGFSFDGWYDGDTLLSEDALYTFEVTEDQHIVAKLTPVSVDEPTITLSGRDTYTYRYENKAANNITASITFPTDSVSYASAYKWYEVDDGGNETLIEDAVSTTMPFKSGKNAGTYKYKVVVTGKNETNGRTEDFASALFTITVNKDTLWPYSSNYSGIYDGKSHTFDFSLYEDSSAIIYYSDSPLDEENYTTGSTIKPSYTNAGDYYTYFYIHDVSGNYEDYISEDPVEVHISKIVVSLKNKGNILTKTYDGSDIVDTVDINDYVAVSSVSGLTLDSYEAHFNSSHVDDAETVVFSNMTLSESSSVNYRLADNTTISVSGSITPKEIEVTWDSTTSFTYDGKSHNLGATIDDDFTFTQSAAKTNAGTYKVELTLATAASGNISDYCFDIPSKNMTITLRDISIAPVDGTFTYDSKTKSLDTYEVSAGSLAENQTIGLFTSSDPGKINADVYDIYARTIQIVEGNIDVTANYNVTEDFGILTINPRDITVSGAVAIDKTYDTTTTAQVSLETIEFTNVLNNDVLTLNPSKVTGEFEQAAPGKDLAVTITIEDNALIGTYKDNYNLTTTTLSSSADINAIVVKVTADDIDATYGTVSSFTYKTNKTVVDLTGEVSYSIKNSSNTVVTYGETTAVGSYTIIPDVSGLSAVGYAFESANGTLVIGKKTISISEASPVTKDYDGNKNATIGATNYTFNGVLTDDINKVALSATAVYDSAEVATGKTVSLSNCSLTGTAAGNYALNSNVATFVGGVINQKTVVVTITGNNASKTYNGLEQSVSGYTFSPDSSLYLDSYTTFSGNSTVTGKTCNNGANKTYYMGLNTSMFTNNNSNFSVTYNITDGYITIKPATITVTADNKNKIYGSANPTFTASYSGFVNSESSSVISGTPAFTCSATQYSVPTTYTINVSASGLSANNYVFTTTSGALTVNKKDLTISNIGIEDRVYNGYKAVDDDQFDLTSMVKDGLCSCDSSLTGIEMSATYDTKDAAVDKPVSITLSLTGDLAVRYNLTSTTTSATSTITRASMKISVKPVTVLYGVTPKYTLIYTTLLGDDLDTDLGTITVGSSGYSSASGIPGTYQIEVSGPAQSTNYNITYDGSTLIIVNKNILASAVVSWSTTNIGTATWKEVQTVAGVTVKDYLVTLYKDGTETENVVDTQIVPNTIFSYNFHDMMVASGAGEYKVRVRANSNNSLLVDDSVPTFSLEKCAANVKVVFGTNGAAGESATIGSAAGSTGIVMIAGESLSNAVTAQLADTYKTGYTMSATTNYASLTLSNTNDDGNGTYTADVAVSSSLPVSDDLVVTVNSTPRPATLTATMTAPSPASIEFGYTEEESSVVSVNVDVETSDNVTKDKYNYAYEWYLRKNAKEGYISESIYTSTYTFPVGQIAFGGYRVYCKVTATRNDQLATDASSKVVTWSGASNPNYYKQIAVTKSSKLSFVAKVTINNGNDWTYDQIAKSLSVAYYDLKGHDYETPVGESIVYEYSDMPSGSTWVSDQPKTAGIWYVRAIVSSDNYIDCISSAQEFTINQKEVTLNWSNTALTYNGSAQKPSATATGLVGTDTCTVTVTGEQTAASSTAYTATASALSNANYKLPSVVTQSYTISPKEVTLSWTNLDLTYNASAQIPVCTVTNKALTTDDVTVTVTPDKTSINADDYTATASITNSNYKLPAVYTKDYTIKKKEVVLSWANLDLTYNKTTQIPTCTVTNKAQESDDVTVTVTPDKTSINADNYTATASISNSNYKLPTVYTKDYTIKKKTVSLTWGTSDFIYNGTNQAPTATAGLLETGDTCTVTVTGEKKNASSSAYTATASALSNSNYKLPDAVTQSFTISPKEISITWGDNAFTYNGKDQAPTATAGLLETGDTCTITVTGAQKNYSATEYTATASSLSNSNYKLPTAVTKTYTIAQKEIGISWGTTAFIYNGSAQKPVATATKVETGDTCTITVTGEQTDVSTSSYTATASSLSNSNYKLPADVTTPFTISQKEVVLSWANLDLTYNKTSQIPTCTVTNKAKDTDDVTVTVTSNKTSINADDYTATASISNPNYKLPTVYTKDYTIKPKTVSLNWGSDAFTYNGTDQKPTVTVGLLETGDECTATTTGEQTNASATAYTVTATKLSNSNYTLPSVATHSYTISPKEISITWGDNAFTYNGKDQAPTATAGELITGDTCTITVTGAQKNYSATAYTATASSLSNSNYKLPTAVTKTYTIAQKEIGITWGDNAFTYNGTAQKPAATATMLETGDTCTITVTGEQTNASSSAYTATASALSNSNYKLPSSVTKTFTIAQKEVVLSWDNLDLTYNKTAQKPTCTVTNKALATDDVTVTVSPDKTSINADDYTATASISNSNYKLPAIYTKDYTIKPKTVSLNWGSDAFTYNGTAQKPTVTVGLLETGDECTATTTGEQTNASATAYTVTATKLSNSNYTLPSVTTHSYTISPKEVVLSWANLDLTYNKTTQIPTCTVTNKALDTDNVTVTVTPNKTSINADNYTATASISNSNYKLPTVYTKDYTIKKKTVSLTWGSDEFIYNGTAQKPTVTAGLLETGDTCTVTTTGEQTNASATAYTVTATALSNSNYTLPDSPTHNYTIAQKVITITWGDNAFTYNGKEQAPTATAGSLITGDTCTITVTGAQKNYSATAYTATASELSNSNYKLPSSVTKTFTIAQRTIGITWTSTSFTYNGTALKPNADATNVVDGDTCTITVTGEQTNASTTAYTATASELSNSNYKLPSNVTQTFTISPKEIGISWSNVSFTYDGAAHKPTAIATLLVGEDKCTITVTGEKTNVSTTDYTATAASLSNSNYKLPSANTTKFVILPKEIGIDWSSTEFTYDGKNHKPTATATQLVTGDTCTITVTGQQKNVSVSDYTATAESLSNSNYKLPTANTTTFKILPKEIGIDWTNKAFTYDGSAHKPTATATQLVTGDTCTITVTGEQTNASAADYTATAESLSNSNYKLPTANTTTFKISPKEIGIDWTDKSFTYDGSAHKPTATATKLVTGDTCTITVTGEKTNASTTAYTATASELSNSNYKLPTANTTTFTISPKEVVLSWTDLDLTYNKSEQKPTCTVTNKALASDDVTVTVTPNMTAINAGDYVATAAISNSNYKLPSVYTKNYTIKKKTVSLNWSNTAFTYDGANHLPTVECQLIETGDTCTATVTGQQKNASSTAYTAQATTLSNSNYQLPSTVTQTFTISPKEITLVWSIDQHHIYDGKDYLPTATAGSLVKGDSCTVTTTGAQKNAGTYTVTASALNNTNYKLPAVNTESFTIEQRTIVLEWADTKVTYNGNAQCSSATVKNLVAGDSCNVATSASGTHTHVGDYTITADSIDNANYKLPTEKTTTMTISPKELTVGWNDLQFIFDNNPHKPTAYGTNLCGSDVVNITVTGAQTNAGIHTATADSIDNDDYKLPSVKPTTKFSIAASVGSYTFIVDEFNAMYDGTEKKPHITVKDGEVTISESEYKVEYSNNINAGEATATIVNVLGNFIVEGSTTFQIEKREVLLTSNTKKAAYTGRPLKGSSVTASKDGFAKNEGAKYTYTTSITDVGSIENEFTYTLNSNTSADNYTITTANGTLTVVKATPVVTLNNKMANYNGKTIKIDDATVKLVNGEKYKGDIQYYYYSDAACKHRVSTPSAQGKYYVKASIDETDNYTAATSKTVTLNICYYIEVSNNGIVIINSDNDLIITTNAPLTKDRNGNVLEAVMIGNKTIPAENYRIDGNKVIISNKFMSTIHEGGNTVTLKISDKSLSAEVFITDLYYVVYEFDGKVPEGIEVPLDDKIYWYGSEVELDDTLNKDDRKTTKRTRLFGYYIFEGWEADEKFNIYQQTKIMGTWKYVNTFPWWIVIVGTGTFFFFIIILFKRRKDDDEEEEEKKRLAELAAAEAAANSAGQSSETNLYN